MIEQAAHLTHGVEDVADGARDDARVGVGAVHGERLAAAGLPVGEGGGVEAVDDGADEVPDDRAVDPLVGGGPVEHVVCGANRQAINPRKEPRAHADSNRERQRGRWRGRGRTEEEEEEEDGSVPKTKGEPGRGPAVRWTRVTRVSSMRHSRSPPPPAPPGEGSAAAGLGGRKRTATEIFSMDAAAVRTTGGVPGSGWGFQISV